MYRPSAPGRGPFFLSISFADFAFLFFYIAFPTEEFPLDPTLPPILCCHFVFAQGLPQHV